MSVLVAVDQGPLRLIERRVGRWVGGVLLSFLVLGAAAGLVRLLPWLLSPSVAPRISLHFAASLALASGEVAAAAALPLGLCLAAVSLQDRGEGLALLLCGVSPWSLLARAWRPCLLVALLGLGAGELLRREVARPGAVLQSWLQAARAGCGGRGREVQEIPGTGASWLCDGERSVLVWSPAPGALVQAREVLVAPAGDVWNLHVSRWSWRGPPEVDLEVGEASVEVGGVAVGRGRRWGLVAGGWLGGWLAAGVLLGAGEGRRWAGVLLGGAVVAAALGAQAAAERWQGGPGGVMLAGALPGLLGEGVRRGKGRLRWRR
ncbi:MAG: hypothetical protein MUF64_11570 [Polyangiaceae bacterium]|nr:hypothetical protein [Polyangiaceae bacterium]